MRLLLDEHLPTALALALRRRGHDAVTLAEWQSGRYRSKPDRVILAAALQEDRVLVSGDVRTIPATLDVLAEQEQDHAGVILVNSRSIRLDDVGTLLRSLCELLERDASRCWRNYLHFLRRIA